MHRALLLTATLLASLAASTSARAGDPEACGGAFDESQIRRDEGHLLEARRLLRVCSDPRCSPTQRRLCASWLEDVDARIPSVVPSATGASGADVNVLIDGVRVATKLDGQAIDVDPGSHSLVFLLADGTKADAAVVAVERTKGTVVSAKLDTQPPPAPTAPASAPAAPHPVTAPAWGPVRTTGVVLGVAGVASLVVGAAFGADALAMKAAHCSNGACDPGSTSTVYGTGTVSTVGLVTGGILLAGGVTLFAFGASSSGKSSASAVLVPSMGPSGGELHLVGSW